MKKIVVQRQSARVRDGISATVLQKRSSARIFQTLSGKSTEARALSHPGMKRTESRDLRCFRHFSTFFAQIREALTPKSELLTVGGLGGARKVFGGELGTLIRELNGVLAV